MSDTTRKPGARVMIPAWIYVDVSGNSDEEIRENAHGLLESYGAEDGFDAGNRIPEGWVVWVGEDGTVASAIDAIEYADRWGYEPAPPEPANDRPLVFDPLGPNAFPADGIQKWPDGTPRDTPVYIAACVNCSRCNCLVHPANTTALGLCPVCVQNDEEADAVPTAICPRCGEDKPMEDHGKWCVACQQEMEVGDEEHCSECGAPLDDAGYDGRCGDCADRVVNADDRYTHRDAEDCPCAACEHERNGDHPDEDDWTRPSYVVVAPDATRPAYGHADSAYCDCDTCKVRAL